MATYEQLIFDPNATNYAVWERPPLVITGASDGFSGVNQITSILTAAGGGTFQINPNGLGSTSSISGSAAASTVQSALEAHVSITPGDVIVTGGPLGSASTPVFIEWTGQFAGGQVTLALSSTGTTGLASSTTQRAIPASSLVMETLEDPPPTAKPEWIGSADSETQLLLRGPLHENRKITMRVRVAQQPDPDTALDEIARLVDRLRAAAGAADGIPAQYTPAGSARSVIYDVLLGEIKELPKSWDGNDVGWFINSPVMGVELTAKPYWRASSEIVTGTASASAPLVTMDATVGGDVPALGRLIVTDTASQVRRDVEWGLENRSYDPDQAGVRPLIIDSDVLLTSGFTGTGATRTGAYDPNASGNNVIRAATVLTAPIAVCATTQYTHVGTYRVWGRVYVARQSQRVRFTWRAGDGRYVSNDWATPPITVAGWCELDLGTITVPTAVTGTQSWDGRVEVYDTDGSVAVAALDVDYLRLMPAGEGYGRARSTFSYAPGSTVAYDQFDGANSSLNGRSAPLGGTWATTLSGTGATDFAVATVTVNGVTSSNASTQDAGADRRRYGVLGSTSYGNTEVSVDIVMEGNVVQQTATSWIEQGVFARWADMSNHVRLEVFRNPGYSTVAGPSTSLALYVTTTATGSVSLGSQALPAGSYMAGRLRLIVYTTGIAIGQMIDTSGVVVATLAGFHAALRTGGTLATGRPGIMDLAFQYTTSPPIRRYDNFTVATPASFDPVVNSGQALQVRYDETIRANTTGTGWGRPQSYRGSRFLLPPGDSRIAVAARRVDLDSGPADDITDATQLQVAYTERGLVVPRT